jgi:hypothetical protein
MILRWFKDKGHDYDWFGNLTDSSGTYTDSASARASRHGSSFEGFVLILSTCQ